MAITGTPAALASAKTRPNRSGMVFRWSSARARREQFVLARHVHWSDVANLAGPGMVPPASRKYVLILDDSRDEQWQAALAGDRDGQMDAFVGVNSPEENQLFAGTFLKRIQREVDPVVDRRQIIQSRRAIRVADGNEISIAILLIDRHDFGRRESVDSGQDRRLNQPCCTSTP